MQWAPTFDQSVLVSSALVDRLASDYQGSIAEDTGPASESQWLAGVQAAGSEPPDSAAGLGDVAAQAMQAHGGRAEGQGLIRPWLDDTGEVNQPLWTALTRRVMAVVMRNPGKMPTLQPTTNQSCGWL